MKAWHETGGLEFPPEWQNDLAAAYVNRGAAISSQGDLSGAVRDYGVAIGLMEELLFVRQFAPVIPNLAKAFYNVILLIRKDDLSPDIRPEEWQTRVETFLNRLGQLTDIEQLPAHWRKKVEDLRGLLNRDSQSLTNTLPDGMTTMILEEAIKKTGMDPQELMDKMGVENLEELMKKIMESGVAPSEP